jgi:hypothetical protein
VPITSSASVPTVCPTSSFRQLEPVAAISCCTNETRDETERRGHSVSAIASGQPGHKEVYHLPYYIAYSVLLLLLALGNLDLRGSDPWTVPLRQELSHGRRSAPFCAIYENKRAPSQRHAWHTGCHPPNGGAYV